MPVVSDAAILTGCRPLPPTHGREGELPRAVMALSLPIAAYPSKGMKRPAEMRTQGLNWRNKVFNSIRRASKKKNVHYTERDRVRVEVLLYLTSRQMKKIDVDNLIKHLGDALQGRLGGGGKKGRHAAAVLPNDSQIFSWTVEKREPHSSKLKSRLRVRRYKEP